jgi:glycoprotein endo-alpha-1,2-mannosidase
VSRRSSLARPLMARRGRWRSACRRFPSSRRAFRRIRSSGWSAYGVIPVSFERDAGRSVPAGASTLNVASKGTAPALQLASAEARIPSDPIHARRVAKNGHVPHRRRIVISLVLLFGAFVVLVALTSRRPTPPAAAPAAAPPPAHPFPRTVFIHYYAWYSAPPFTPTYGHWDGGDPNRPGLPANITSASYPLLGPYSSTDPAVLRQQMAWIKAAQADVIAYSWWGVHDVTEANAPAVLDAAAAQGLHVSFQLEPYKGRTVSSMIDDIRYLYGKYGGHPAFYRVSRPTMYGPSTAPRGVFFVYSPPQDGTLDSLRGTADDAIILARTDDGKLYSDSDIRASLRALRADGLYNYGAYTYHALPKLSSDYIVVYSAAPGFDNSRAAGVSNPSKVPRQDGAYYDRSWGGLAAAKPEGVAVVSFNEWHETTQIEPAKPFFYDNYTYQDYQGHYGLTGADAALAYIERTAYWVSRYKA